MEYYGADTKLVDIVFSNYHLVPVLNRFDIRLGFGEKTVTEICKEKAIDIGFFLTIINLYSDKNLITEEEFLKYPLKDLINFLEKSHQHYKSNIIARHHRLFINLRKNGLKGLEGIDTIHDVYRNEVQKFIEHMDYEEDEVFPFLLSLEDTEEDRKKGLEMLSNIDDFHDILIEELYDMRSILIKYLVQEEGQSVSNELLFSIFDFAEDLSMHSKIENSILLRYLKK